MRKGHYRHSIIDLLNQGTQPLNRVRSPSLCPKLPRVLYDYIVSANSGGSGEVARIRKHVWAFAYRLCDSCLFLMNRLKCKKQNDKTNNVVVRPAKTQVSLGIRPVWTESSLSACRKLGSLVTHLAHSEDSDQTWRMPRLICVFAGRTVKLLVLSRGGSFVLLV